MLLLLLAVDAVYPAGGGVFHEMATSFPRLYLAAGVTTIRTTGSIEPYTDIEIKRDVDRGLVPGPKIWLTGPYLEGEIPWNEQMHRLHGPEEFRRTVDYWADQGMTSFRLYNFMTRAELAAAVDEAHKRGLKITGHLCPVGFTEAARLGIDNLDHGIFVDTEFYSGKKPDVCNAKEALEELEKLSPSDPRLAALIKELVQRKVAVTSTLPVFAAFTEQGFRRALTPAVLQTLSTEARARLLENHVAASWNGALFLGVQERIGSIAPGKDADLVVVKGDPSKTIADIENVEIVFKDGVGYDAPKLADSVRGLAGIR